MKKRKRMKRYIMGALAAMLFLTGIPLTNMKTHAAFAGNRCPEGTDEETALRMEEAGEALAELAAERDIMALVYLADEYPIRSKPSYESEAELTVLSGQLVNILDVCMDEYGGIWERVRLEYNGVEYCGYVPRAYLAVADARFLKWEAQYGMDFSGASIAFYGDGRVSYPDIGQFPESYQPALLALKEQHPNWIFARMNTALDWDTVIYNEMQGEKSLVYKTLPDWAKNGLYDEGNWYYATEAAVEVYMDPRNSLTEAKIFQFEQLTYNEQYHTLEAIQAFLDNTFMNGSKPAPGMDTMTFAEMFWYIGKEEGRKVSPFHLAARVLQEQGQGNSPLISGTYPGYEGYYNYFNVGASGNTEQMVIESGLRYAREHGWKDSYKAVLGGADFISANYIKKGQDTLYLQKFNVNPNGTYPLFTHQYMQNISAPATEAKNIRKLYAEANSLESTFVFKIPVYENMPEQPCAEPGKEPVPSPEPPVETLDISLKLPAGYSGNVVWLDGVAYEGVSAEGKLTVTAPDKTALTAVVYRYDESGVPVGMYVWSLNYGSGAYTATAESELEDLLTYHGFSIRITGKAGIRFKTGISADLRDRLILGGVNGYRLQEYGTLVMSNANREKYPMIKDGTKVQSGMAYGTAPDGSRKDVIFETVNGRHRYTAVMVGMPAAQYKTELAFRGYMILEKNGDTVIIYGPPMAKSVYTLAEQLLERGAYEPGSEVYEFLQKLIDDADGIEEVQP